MATLTQTSAPAIAAMAADDGSNECCVCAEVISTSEQSVRSCGHMMCTSCDSNWRSRGTFIREECINKKGEKFAMYASYSLCPMCRAQEPAKAYMNRSKESLIHEIQMLAATVHMKCGGRVDPYSAIDISSMGNKPPPLTRATASPLEMLYGALSWRTYEEDPYLPLLSAPVARFPVPAPRPPSTPAPVHRAPRPIGAVAGPVIVTPAVRVQTGMEGRYVTVDTCIRRFKRLGCTTARTKLRCPSCQYNLCRSCRGQCPCV